MQHIDVNQILTNIYSKMQEIHDKSFLTPYYLLISKPIHMALEEEIAAKNTSHFKNGKLHFFENMEVVVFYDAPAAYLEIKALDFNER